MRRSRLITYAISLFLLLIAATAWGLAIVLLGFVWLFFRARSGRSFCVPLLVFPLVCLVGLQAILLSCSLLPQYGLDRVLTNLLLVLVFIFVADSLKGEWTARTWENALISFAVLFCLLELILVVFWYRRWWQISGSLFSLPPVGYRAPGLLFGNPNPMAGFINLVWPIALVRLMGSRKTTRRVLWGGVLMLLLVVQYYTSSRGGWLGAIVGFCTMLGLLYLPALIVWLSSTAGRRLGFSRRHLLRGVALTVIVLGLAYLFVRQASFTPGHAPIASSRAVVWNPSWRIFTASPLLGHGLGSFPVWHALVTRLPPGASHDHAHNFWLQVGAETGIVGIVLVILAVGLVSRAFVRAWRTMSLSTSQRRAMVAYAGVGMALVAHHAVDYFFQMPLYSVIFFLIVALAIHRTPRSEYFILPRAAALTIVSGCLGICLVGNLISLRGASIYQSGLAAAREGDWMVARDDICEAAQVNPSVTLYSFQCSLANAYVVHQTDDPQALAAALSFQRRGLEQDPYWPLHWANLATLEWQQGDHSRALLYMRRALFAAPRNDLFALNLGWMEEQLGHRDAAADAYGLALRSNPWLQDSLFFTLSPLRREVLQRQSLHGHAYAGPQYRPSDQFLWRGWNALQENRLHIARHYFQLTLQSQPSNASAYVFLALVNQRAGRPDEAWRNAQIALFINDKSPRVLDSAAQIALGQGREAEAMCYLSQAFDCVRQAGFSRGYYSRVYHRPYLPTDLSPLFQRADLTAEMADDFTLLAQYLQDSGESDKALQVLKWVEWHTSGP